MALDADPGVEAVASQPMWLHWVSESGKARRHAPDFFVSSSVAPEGHRCAFLLGVVLAAGAVALAGARLGWHGT
jgi:hypothetical protein